MPGGVGGARASLAPTRFCERRGVKLPPATHPSVRQPRRWRPHPWRSARPTPAIGKIEASPMRSSAAGRSRRSLSRNALVAPPARLDRTGPARLDRTGRSVLASIEQASAPPSAEKEDLRVVVHDAGWTGGRAGLASGELGVGRQTSGSDLLSLRRGTSATRQRSSPATNVTDACVSSKALWRASRNRVSTCPVPTAPRVGKGVPRGGVGGHRHMPATS